MQYWFIIDYWDKWKIAIPKLPLSSEADRVATNRAVICDFWNLLCLGGVQSQTNLCTWIRFAGYNDLGLVMLKNNSWFSRVSIKSFSSYIVLNQTVVPKSIFVDDSHHQNSIVIVVYFGLESRLFHGIQDKDAHSHNFPIFETLSNEWYIWSTYS